MRLVYNIINITVKEECGSFNRLTECISLNENLMNIHLLEGIQSKRICRATSAATVCATLPTEID
jgi:hypothetical protein